MRSVLATEKLKRPPGVKPGSRPVGHAVVAEAAVALAEPTSRNIPVGDAKDAQRFADSGAG